MNELFQNLKENEYVFVTFRILTNARTVPQMQKVTIFNLKKNERGQALGQFNLDGVEQSAPVNFYGWLSTGQTGGLFKEYTRAIQIFNRMMEQRAIWMIRSEIDI